MNREPETRKPRTEAPLIEDNRGNAHLIREMLAGVHGGGVALTWVDPDLGACGRKCGYRRGDVSLHRTREPFRTHRLSSST